MLRVDDGMQNKIPLTLERDRIMNFSINYTLRSQMKGG